MSRTLQKFSGQEAWRYCFALLTCGCAIGLESLLDRMTDDPPHPFALSFFAILVSTLWAGVAPGVLATLVLVVWSASYSLSHGLSITGTAVRCGVFLILGFGSTRIWKRMKYVSSSETLHRRLVEAAPQGIWVHDEHGVITYANARMAAMLGLAVKELIGRNAQEFILPGDRASERVRTANLHEGRDTQFDRRLQRADGGEIWVLTCSSQIASDTPFHKPSTLAMMTEITERKRAESALRQSEEHFRGIFEGVPAGVYQTTRDGRVLSANPTIVAMLGFDSEEELRRVDLASDLFVDPQLRCRLSERLERDGQYQNARYELRRRDGRNITVLDNARVVRDADGAVLHYAGTLIDITGDTIFHPAAFRRTNSM